MTKKRLHTEGWLMFKIGRLLNKPCLITAAVLLLTARLAAQQPHVQRITLDEAKARAAAAANAADLARLSVDAAKYHRQAAQADYFPKIESTFANLHFNKFMGQTIQLARRSADLPLARKD